VNDAPALKKADCGFAVSTATDAARAAASIVLTTPGLSVIIDAIKESRRIFQRMNSYAIYRIAETLRVLLFVTAAILIFNFFPLTAVMIVMLALLNDGAILSIAYDNVHYKDQPEAWNMRLVLGVATVLGVMGPIAAFGLFYLGDQVLHLSHTQLQPMMYLMLSVAGHMTIFLTRTRGPFWSIAPAPALWIACLGTQILATCIAVFGFLMPPLDWRWAAAVWGYALIWALLSDRVKLLAYRIFDSPKAAEAAKVKGIAARAKVEAKPAAKSAPASTAEADAKPDTQPSVAPAAQADAKPDAKAAPAPEAKADAKPEAKVAPVPEAKTEAKPDVKAAPPEAKTGAKPDAKSAPTPEVKGEPKAAPATDAKSKTPTDLTPQLVERVHALYEELGRQDVLAVQELEKAEKTSKEEAVP
jgi:H+-transporting ATPase